MSYILGAVLALGCAHAQKRQVPPGRPQPAPPVDALRGVPIRLASVKLIRVLAVLATGMVAEGNPAVATADNERKFAIANAAPGLYNLFAERTGYERGEYGRPWTARPRHRVDPGACVAPGDYRLLAWENPEHSATEDYRVSEAFRRPRDESHSHRGSDYRSEDNAISMQR